MNEPVFIFDVHLDLSMNALEWNRDLRWSLETHPPLGTAP